MMNVKAAAIAAAMTAVLFSGAMPASAQCGSASWYALYSQTASGEQHEPSAE